MALISQGEIVNVRPKFQILQPADLNNIRINIDNLATNHYLLRNRMPLTLAS